MNGSLTTRVALRILKDLKRRDAEYEEEVAYWHSQGYRPHYCIHGTDQWTDYDNICGPCEEGWTNYQIALGEARRIVSAYFEQIGMVVGLLVALNGSQREDLRPHLEAITRRLTADLGIEQEVKL